VALVPPPPAAQSEFVWFSRAGTRGASAIESGPGGSFDLSSDGRFAVTTGVDLLDFDRGVRTRVASLFSLDALLSPDGRQVAYTRNLALIVQGAGGGTPRTILTLEPPKRFVVKDWSTDGRFIIGVISFGTTWDIVAIPVDGQSPPQVLVSGLAQSDQMQLSPDGRWLAFNASVTDRHEVYVTPVPPTGERIQISTAGGTSPRWRDDGRELYYLDPEGRLMVVTIDAREGRLEVSRPAALFQTPIEAPTYNEDHYAPGPGGRSFLFQLPLTQPDVRVTLLVNWF
jgi:Tol biopolymer transport system component